MVGHPKGILSLIAALLLGLAVLSVAPAQEYTIGAGDVLTITVWGQSDLSRDYPVDADGFVPFPLVGRVQARGLTTREIAARLTELLEKDYLANPHVIVSVKNTENTFFILGEVKKPGAYPLEKETNILEGVTIAGGFTDKAAPGRTRVIRRSPTGQHTIDVDMNDIIKPGQRDKAMRLQAGDVVVVPESFF